MSIYKHLSKNQPTASIDDSLEEYISDDEELKAVRANNNSKQSNGNGAATKNNVSG